MTRVDVSHDFATSPEAVWDVYTDHARWREWFGMGGSSLEVEGSPDRNGTGAVRCLGAGPSRVYEEVLDFQRPKRMTYKVVRGAVPFKNHMGEVVFEPHKDGTRVHWRCHFDSKIPGMGGLLGLMVTQLFRRGLRRLERHSFSAPR